MAYRKKSNKTLNSPKSKPSKSQTLSQKIARENSSSDLLEYCERLLGVEAQKTDANSKNLSKEHNQQSSDSCNSNLNNKDKLKVNINEKN